MLIKAEELITSQKLGSHIFGESLIVFSTKINLLLIDLEVLSSGSGKAKLFPKNFTKNSKLDNSSISLPVFPSRTNIPVVVLKNSSIGV